MSEVAIRIENLSKEYRLGVFSHGTLYRDIQTRWAKLRGKDDPNAKIGSQILGNSKEINERFLALKDISFDVKQGDVVGIIGRNGAGKSTLLKILSRVTAPTKGTVKIKGRVASLLEVGTGFHSELTGRENIYLNGAILGMTKREIAQKFDEIVEFAEIGKFIDTPVKRYSSGMFVRLAFAVAAHLEPEILIVDEVLAVGDINFRKKCMGKMKDISTSAGRTILFVSHDMSAIQNICTNAVLLRQGELAYSGPTTETVKHYLSDIDMSGNGRKEWVAPANKQYPFADVVRINRFYIADESGEVVDGRLFNSKRYLTVVEADLVRGDPRLLFSIGYYDEHHSLLFYTDVHDAGGVNFSEIRPGKIMLSAPLPVELLWNRTYEIELICALHHTGWVLQPDNESKIRFEFFRDIDLNPYSGESRQGALAPVLKWEVFNKTPDFSTKEI